MAMIGPIIEKQQKIINDCVEKKLTLSKLQSNMWQKNTDKEEDFTLSDLDMNDDTIQSLLKKDINSEGSYKMKK
jgi:hypothetical protein